MAPKQQRGIKVARKKGVRFFINKIPAVGTNLGYNVVSQLYKGQLFFGLPVSKKLKQRQQETRALAVGKLALSLYHIFIHITKKKHISRKAIKSVLLDELEQERLRLTENVIILSEQQLEYLAKEKFQIPRRYIPEIISAACRRRIIKEDLRQHRAPAYFESEIEERDQNGRGDYEIVNFREFTDAGKGIGFRRLASMEDVTAGDNSPSLVMVPGLACNSNCFNLDDQYSLAKDMADNGSWVYLFDPRGLGVNKDKFDPLLTIDSMIDHDLAAVVRFISKRSKGKPMVLIGHSMGGIVSELMVLNWGLRRNFDQLTMLTSEQREMLDKVLPSKEEAEENLSMIRAVITFGSPQFFEKTSHLVFPSSLWLNHLSRFFRLPHFPLRKPIWFLTELPGIRQGTKMVLNTNLGDLNPLILPENHKNNKDFIIRFIQNCGESIPLGMGFQFIKSIYNGEGFKRMDGSNLNYSELHSFFPADIPIFRFWGTDDPLAPPDVTQNNQFYPHREKKIYHLSSGKDLRYVEISNERSQIVDFIVDKINHIDLLYGKQATEVIHPLLKYIVRQVWGNWDYKKDRKAA